MMDVTRRYRRAKGLCPGCGRIRKYVGYVYCEVCRAGFADYHTRARAAKQTLSLGERLRRHRQKLGYRQTEFAVILGISHDHVRALEHGNWPAKPPKTLQRRLAAVLGCAVEDLGIP